jgi:hypothetical protein
MLRISHWCRFFLFAASAWSLAAASAKATSITLKHVNYEAQIIYPSAKNTIESNFPFDKFTPGDVPRFIQPGSDPGTSIDPSSTILLTSDRGPAPNQVFDRASAVVALNGGGGAGGLNMNIGAFTFYDVRVKAKDGKTPPSDLTGVPVIGTSKGSTQCSGANVSADAFVLVFLPDTNITWRSTCKNGAILLGEFNKGKTGDFPIGTPVSVNIEASGSMVLNVEPVQVRDSASFSSYADPAFEIDPSFAYADDFELEYSPGIAASPNGPGDGTSVPEPGSLLLLALAAFFGAIVRQRSVLTRGERFR